MKYEILLAPEAEKDLDGLKPFLRARVKDGIELYLRHEPQKTSKTRIKRLQGMSRPQYRLRVENVRVFYDVSKKENRVEILAIIPKEKVEKWLKKEGEFDEDSGSP